MNNFRLNKSRKLRKDHQPATLADVDEILANHSKRKSAETIRLGETLAEIFKSLTTSTPAKTSIHHLPFSHASFSSVGCRCNGSSARMRLFFIRHGETVDNIAQV